MVITNELLGESFGGGKTKKKLAERENDLALLMDVAEYCQKLGEKIEYDESIWNIEVEDGIFLYEIVCGIENGSSHDCAVMCREIITKQCRPRVRHESMGVIKCSCGNYDSAAYDLDTYAGKRQQFLLQMKDVHEFGEFMSSCFPNTIFSDGCEGELKYIAGFEDNIEEIVKCLSVLDRKAVGLYEQYHTDLSMAMRTLEAELSRECSPDSKHKQYLQFEFTYIDEDEKSIMKKIECQPHLKLIHSGSNLRIYFAWKDSTIGDGKKVLVGRVGRHPY